MIHKRYFTLYQHLHLILTMPPSEVDQLGRKHSIPKLREDEIAQLCHEFIENMSDSPAVIEINVDGNDANSHSNQHATSAGQSFDDKQSIENDSKPSKENDQKESNSQQQYAKYGNLPSVQKINDLIIVGDIRGNFHSLIQIFSIFGPPPYMRYLFIGDLIDGGNFSLEVLSLLFILKCMFHDYVYILRGSCEQHPCQTTRCFQDEIYTTYKTKKLVPEFLEAFRYLPIGALLSNGVYVTHLQNLNEFHDVQKLMNTNLPIEIEPYAFNVDSQIREVKIIDHDQLSLFAEEFGFTGLILGGSRRKFQAIFINADQTQFFISASEPNCEGAVLKVYDEIIEPIKFINPPTIPRELAIIADVNQEKNSCYNISSALGRRKIHTVKRIWNFSQITNSILNSS
ncbi:hypothetical protein TRFO_12795 [Tritrichomonas foetus]|uniref:protein-serine/threonine phosphatase n=1 Tax=Tritrichomonas foetus TaxID=1144522 RepID=A0A1J4L1H5_9EUKA|nr:hypothetical protein TRFO_12795 [Tritrichomonas foetus]|eukprot:OHT16920.1 hypothetical protein TRFO_12795 [Tritrichomonas foetus]